MPTFPLHSSHAHSSKLNLPVGTLVLVLVLVHDGELATTILHEDMQGHHASQEMRTYVNYKVYCSKEILLTVFFGLIDQF